MAGKKGGRKGRRGWGWIRASGRRDPKRWQASYLYELARHNAPHTFGSRMEAEAWLANERRLIDMEVWTPPAVRAAERRVKAVTVDDYGKTWIEQRTAPSGKPLAPKTRLQYENLLAAHIKPGLGHVALGSLTPQVIRAWHASTLVDKPVMRAHAYGLLHAICATAVKDGLLQANPCQIERAMKAHRTRQPVILTVDEVATVADEITPKFRALFLIASWCGLRWGEVVELRRKDIDKDAQVITVARGMVHRKGCHISTPKSGKGRPVVVPPHIRPDIKQHLKTFVDDDAEALLFAPARRGCHLNDTVFREHFNAALAIVGRDGKLKPLPTILPTIHDMRHFCGTQTARVANLAETMDRLGHSTVQASLLYQQIVSGRDAAVADALSALATVKSLTVEESES